MGQIFPQFLIIGAMKSGTTQLYHDLQQHPKICFSKGRKEIQLLSRYSDDKERIRQEYQKYYDGMEGFIRGEASTSYTLYPKFKKIPELANEILGEQVKLIYVIREPYSRMLSHYQHGFKHNHINSNDINQAIIEDESLVSGSKYYEQLEKWLSVYGEANHRVIIFEDYIRQRKESVKEIFKFLQVHDDFTIDENRGEKNEANSKVKIPPMLYRLTHNKFFLDHVNEKIPKKVKHFFKALFKEKMEVNLELGEEKKVAIKSELLADSIKLKEKFGLDLNVWQMK